MNYRTASETAWDKALATARAIVEGLEAGDRVCVFRADDQVTPVVEQLTADRDFVAAQIASLRPEPSSSQLRPAALAALNVLAQEKKRSERELHIITDGQALPWKDFGAQRTNEPNPRTSLP